MSDPLPLEQTDPVLAEAIWRLVHGQHRLKSIEVNQREVVTVNNYKRMTVRPRKQPGRNEPCACESGRKWKKCCGRNV